MKKLLLTILFTLILSGGANAGEKIVDPFDLEKVKKQIAEKKAVQKKDKKVKFEIFAKAKGAQQFFIITKSAIIKPSSNDLQNLYNTAVREGKIKCRNSLNKLALEFNQPKYKSLHCIITAIKYSEEDNPSNNKKIVDKTGINTINFNKIWKLMEKDENIEDEGRIVEEKIKPNKKTETNNEIKKEFSENEKIVILIDDNQLVNNEKIAEIKFSKSQFVKMNAAIKKEELEKLFNSHSYVYLIKNKDFVVNSSSGKQKNIQSNYISGTRPKPNPQYQRINLEISNLNNYINSLTQEYYQKQSIANQNCQNLCNNNYNVGQCWSCTGAKTAAAIRMGIIRDEVANADSAIIALQNELLNTEQIIYEEISSPYAYVLNEINGIKEARYEVFLVNNNNYFRARVNFTEEKIFNIPSEVSTQDTNKNLINNYDSIDDVKNWEEKKMKDISENKFFQLADGNLKKIGKKELFASFSSDKKEKNNNFTENKTTKTDPRFESVVVIETLNSLGSGFFVKPNQIITNFHVVDGAKRITIKNFNGEKSSAKILKIDTRRDLALLETNFRGNAVKFFTSEIYPGLEVEAIGHPNGLNYSLTKGVVSNIRDYSSTYNVTQNANTKFIQTDVAINSGNSGGPLFHKEFVIGVNTQGLIKSKFEGLNFSVHLDELLDFLN